VQDENNDIFQKCVHISLRQAYTSRLTGWLQQRAGPLYVAGVSQSDWPSLTKVDWLQRDRKFIFFGEVSLPFTLVNGGVA